MIATLHHYALEVPDLAVAEGFLQDFGLETGEKDGSLVAQCPGRSQEQVRMVEAPAKRLHHVSFTLRPGTLDAVQEALERSGTPVTDPPPGATPDGLWIRDPDGTAVQLLAEEPSPARPVPEVLTNMGAAHQRIGTAWWRQATEDVMPRRLGHTLLFTAQPERMTEFYTTVLGLRVSDRITGLVTFLNGDPEITTSWASSRAATAASTTPASRCRPSTRSRSGPTGCGADDAGGEPGGRVEVGDPGTYVGDVGERDHAALRRRPGWPMLDLPSRTRSPSNSRMSALGTVTLLPSLRRYSTLIFATMVSPDSMTFTRWWVRPSMVPQNPSTASRTASWP